MQTFLAVSLALIVGFGVVLGLSMLLWLLWTGIVGEHDRILGTVVDIGDDVIEGPEEAVRRRKRFFLEALELIVLSLTAAAVLISWSSP